MYCPTSFFLCTYSLSVLSNISLHPRYQGSLNDVSRRGGRYYIPDSSLFIHPLIWGPLEFFLDRRYTQLLFRGEKADIISDSALFIHPLI